MPPSNAKVKNEWSCTSALPRCHYGMHRDKFTFTSWHSTHYSQFASEVPSAQE
jgi:hypothetical protein